MKQPRLAAGDRVRHSFLGEGVVIDPTPFDPLPGMVLVSFDDTPPLAYNMGHRQCLVFDNDLVDDDGIVLMADLVFVADTEKGEG